MEPDQPVDLPPLEADGFDRDTRSEPPAPTRPAAGALARSAPMAADRTEAPPTFLLDEAAPTQAAVTVPALAVEPEPALPPTVRARLAAFSWRGVATYALLWCLPFPFATLPFAWSQRVTAAIDGGRDVTVRWLCEVVGGVALPASNGVGGDTLGQAYAILFTAVAAMLVAVPWTLLRWSRPHHAASGARPRELLSAWLRFVVASALIGPGLSMVVPLRYGPIEAAMLARPLGQLTPDELLHACFAVAPGYVMALGVVQVLAGLLLCWRQTATLGALFAAACLAEAALLSIAYDRPDKLAALHLLAFAVLVAARDRRRLLGLFVHGTAAPAPAPWPWPRWLRRPTKALQLAFVGWLVFAGMRAAFEEWQVRNVPAAALVGGWDVAEFARDGVEVDRTGAPQRWWTLQFAADGSAELRRADQRGVRLFYEFDPKRRVLTLRPVDGADPAAPLPIELQCRQPDRQHLELDGLAEGARLRVRCLRIGEDLPLLQHRTRWLRDR